MPARIVVALNEPQLADHIRTLLATVRQDVRVYADAFSALKALEDAHTVRVLIISLEFPPGQLNGVALANMGRMKRSGLKVVFLGSAELQAHAAGLGELVVPPFNAARIAGLAMALLAEQGETASPTPN